MIRWTFFCVVLAAIFLLGNSENTPKKFDQDTDWENATSVYDFHAKNIEGKDVSLDDYKGYVLIVVNVASNCGLTDRNYKQLQALYKKYEKDGLRILAFPCNQFNEQEPGTSKEIKEFVTKNYNVTFDMFEKIEVNGNNAHPLWKWMKSQEKGAGTLNDSIKWNFTKFLINRNGQVVDRFSPKTDPDDMEPTLKTFLEKKDN